MIKGYKCLIRLYKLGCLSLYNIHHLKTSGLELYVYIKIMTRNIVSKFLVKMNDIKQNSKNGELVSKVKCES